MLLLGLGSNLSSSFGDRFKNIELAITYLESYQFKLIKKSSYYETFSYPDRNNPKFINVVIKVKTTLSAAALMKKCLIIEKRLGRLRNKKNDPRTCDIDIIDFHGQNMKFKYESLDFTVPHEKLSYRNFVLFPLKEVMPNWIHPKSKESINMLIEKLSSEDKNSILKVENS